MTYVEIQYAAKDIATRLVAELKASRIHVGNADVVNAAVAGFLVGNARVLSGRQLEDFQRMTFRAFVEACT